MGLRGAGIIHKTLSEVKMKKPKLKRCRQYIYLGPDDYCYCIRKLGHLGYHRCQHESGAEVTWQKVKSTT